MLSQLSYPIICAQDLAQTVNFYEDHFSYVVAVEVDGFVLMKREGHEGSMIAIMDKNHAEIPEAYRHTVKGMILSMPVDDVEKMYEEAYWEGLSIVAEPSDSGCAGRRHFLVEDPNGILIDVRENVDVLAKLLAQDGAEEKVFVSECV